jgi:hypothetical protein
MYILDSAHVLHVAAAFGDDANAGHAQQYPVNLATDAKLTIGSALSAAVDGDIIVIWPGTYAEAVDFDTANKAIIMIGTHRGKCIIYRSDAGNTVTLESGCELHDLTIQSQLSGTSKAVTAGSAKQDLVIAKCNILGYFDGIDIQGATNLSISDSLVMGSYDGMNCAQTEVVCNNCTFETDGAIASAGSAVVSETPAFGSGFAVFSRCVLKAVRTSASSEAVYGIRASTTVVLNDCAVYAETKEDADGPATAVRAFRKSFMALDSDGLISFVGGCCLSRSNGDTAMDLSTDANSQITINGVAYDAAKTEGNIYHNRDIALARKLLANKAVQTKATGAIDYYDDDGSTVLLTHTPTDSESTVTRTPG